MSDQSTPVILALDDAFRGIGIVGVRQLYDWEYDLVEPTLEARPNPQFKHLDKVKTLYGDNRNGITNPAKILKFLIDIEYQEKKMGGTGICFTDAPQTARKPINPEITTLFERIHKQGVIYAPNDYKYLKDSPLYETDDLNHTFAIGFDYCEAFKQLNKNASDIILKKSVSDTPARKWWQRLIP